MVLVDVHQVPSYRKPTGTHAIQAWNSSNRLLLSMAWLFFSSNSKAFGPVYPSGGDPEGRPEGQRALLHLSVHPSIYPRNTYLLSIGHFARCCDYGSDLEEPPYLMEFVFL